MAQELEVLAKGIGSALSASPHERQWGESILEASSVQPKHCERLLHLVCSATVDNAVRLLAATQLKNEVLRHWSRSGRIAHEERGPLRDALLTRLAHPEPHEGVGVQIALTIARIMRSETNCTESLVLRAFSTAMQQPRELLPHALFALLYTCKELCAMRLPAQRRLGAEVARVLLSPTLSHWRSSLSSSLEAGAPPHSSSAPPHSSSPRSALLLGILYTKIVRRLSQLALNSRGEGADAEWGSTSQQALRAAAAVQERCGARLAAGVDGAGGAGGVGGVAELGRLGGALGKLLLALSDHPHFAWEGAVASAQETLFNEAATRTALLDACVGGGAAQAQSAQAALCAREEHCSSLPTHCAALLARFLDAEDSPERQPLLRAWTAATPLPPLLAVLRTLAQRGTSELIEWEADPECYACEWLLPPLDDVAPDDDDFFDLTATAADDEDGSVPGGQSRVQRLKHSAERVFGILLELAPSEVGAALVNGLLPTHPCQPSESLRSRLERDASYVLLGLGASELSSHGVSFRNVLEVAGRDGGALASGAGPIAALIQARLCWLLSCWWAFGGSGVVEDDQSAGSEAYLLLTTIASGGKDLAARLQASQVLCSLLRASGPDELDTFAPLTPGLLSAIGASMATCESDEALLWLLETMREALASAPAALHATVLPALGALHAKAAHSRREVLLNRLQEVAELAQATSETSSHQRY